jgi:uncharacterized repeat protein (TIGR03803 family)
MDLKGNLYGTTELGGLHRSEGTVFKLSPGLTPADPWTEQVLYRFCPQKGCADGAAPIAASGLVLDKNGNLFGTTRLGGNPGGDSKSGNGVVYELSQASSGGPWIQSVLYRFCSQRDCDDGYYLHAGLATVCDKGQPGPREICSVDRLYGTTFGGGIGDSGTVYELTRQQP